MSQNRLVKNGAIHYTKVVMLQLKRPMLWIVLAGLLTSSLLSALAPIGNVSAATASPSPSGSPSASPASGPPNASCDAGTVFTWVICPIISLMDSGISWAEGQVQTMLKVSPLDATNNPAAQSTQLIWSSFRNLADVFFVLIFFVIIFGTGLGLDNYTVKKTLPRLIAATILVQFSFLIVGILVDVSNVLGAGINTLIAAVNVPGVGPDPAKHALDVVGGIEAVGVAGAAGFIAVSVGAIMPVMLAVVSALLGLVAVFVTLQLRLLLINFLIVIAPLAFVLWTLPNTEKYFSKWWKFLLELLLMYPIIILLFSVAALFTNITNASNDKAIEKALASIAPIIAFFLVPATFRFASRTLSAAYSRISGATSGASSGLRNKFWGKQQQEDRRTRGQLRAKALQQDQGRATTLLGKAKNNALTRGLARTQGFGAGAFIKPKEGGLNALRQHGAEEKAASMLATGRAEEQARAQSGTHSQEEIMAGQQAVALESIMDAKIGEAKMREVQYTNSEGKTVTDRAGSLDLNEDSIQALANIARTSFASGDNATGIAMMQSLSRSPMGRDAMADIRTDTFGGNNQSTVNAAALGGNAKAVWDKSVANVDGKSAPDLVKPPSSAYGGLSAADFASMDFEAKGRYLNDAATRAPETGGASAAAAAQVVAEAMSSRTLSTKFGNADFMRMESFATGAGASRLGTAVDNNGVNLQDRIRTGAAIERGETPPPTGPTPPTYQPPTPPPAPPAPPTYRPPTTPSNPPTGLQ